MKNIELLQNNGISVENGVQLLGSIEFYDETLLKFLNEANDKLMNIKTAKDNNDITNYKNYVHSLKNDSTNLGFQKLVELCDIHETASQNSDIKFINENYNELILETIRVINIARQYNGQDIISHVNEEKGSIIVADDSIIIRNFLNKILSSEFDLIEAKDGREVINIVESNNENIVGLLLDLNMPNVDGFQVLDYFKNNNLFDKIPVSLITGDDTKDAINKAFQYPIVDMLNKPFSENDVKKIVNRTINRHNSL